MKINAYSAFVTTAASILLLILSGMTQAAEVKSSIARGGNLYDKWFKVFDVDAPGVSHGLYPNDKKYAEKPKANWRCKECHGWDYMGAKGGYASGKHSTGIVGTDGARGKSNDEIIKGIAHKLPDEYESEDD